VVIPIYNEATTLKEVVSRVRQLGSDCEVVLVDDGSDDGSSDIVRELLTIPGIITVQHPKNRGKGAALRSGLAVARGAIVIIQDADLEYDPQNIERLAAPIAAGEADVVYGSRLLTTENAWASYPQRLANVWLTKLSNWATGLNLSDMETCHKAFGREVLAGVTLHESGFGIEPELTAKIALGSWRIQEIAISYHARTKRAGKKIGFGDGLWAVWCIVRYGLSGRFARRARWRPRCQL
jgi:glycosyltransferase involved in cell wall biosynthesis